MFDLIDDLNAEVWVDKGRPPDDLKELPEFGDYSNYHIIARFLDANTNTIRYTVADDTGKDAKSVVIRDIKTVDPLKNVRHFHAILEDIDDFFVVTSILLDMDWCVRQ